MFIFSKDHHWWLQIAVSKPLAVKDPRVKSKSRVKREVEKTVVSLFPPPFLYSFFCPGLGMNNSTYVHVQIDYQAEYRTFS